MLLVRARMHVCMRALLLRALLLHARCLARCSYTHTDT
jgi:hypothetical protein